MKSFRHFRPFSLSLYCLFLSISMFAPEAYSKGNDIGLSNSTQTTFLAPPVCNTPTWPVTSNITMNAATFSWDAVYGAQSYTVQTRIPNGTWYSVPGSPFTNTYATVSWFLPNTTYEWRVRTNCTGGEYSYWSSPITFTTLGWDNCNAPSWLTTTNISATSATFDWEAVDGAISYDLQYRVWGGSWINVSGGPFTQTWYTISNLLPATTYEWRVRSNCSNWMESPWSYIEVFTTLEGYGYCDAPSWLYTTNITSTSATLDWEPVSGAISYNIQWKEQGSGYWHDIPGGNWNETWYTLYNLNPNTTYQWRVQSNCSNWSHSSWSYIESFTTTGGYCNAPTWPTTSNITQTSAKFSWDAAYGANSYTVQIRVWGGSWYDLQGGPFYNSWITVNGLSPCTTYEWRVRTNCGNWQYSYWSNPTVFTTICGNYCDAPSWLYSSNITHNSATLGWDAVPGAYSYSVQYKVTGGAWQDFTGSTVYNNWVSLWGLQPGTSYEWRVRTNCSNWSYSSWSYSSWFTTLGYSCGTPSWLSTTNVTESSANFNWSSVWGAWSYTVQIRQSSGGIWTNVPGSPFLSNSAWVSGLLPGTTYQWRVRTDCEDGQYGTWSYPVSFTTLNVTVCNAPQWLYSTNITTSSANLSWTSVAGALNYNVEYRIAGGTWYILAGSPFTNTQQTITGLLAGTTYEWRVNTKCYFGMLSGWSYSATFTTLGNACAVPTGLTSNNITDTTATLSWHSVSDGISYGVQTRSLNGVWNDVPGTPVADTTITVDGLIPGATYEWRVRAKCGAGVFSYWSNPATFTTTGSTIGGVDECSGATVLTVNSSCINSASSNVGATESAPEPMGWCPENNHKDVWFKFNMPDVASPVVTIRTTAGTLFDGIMEVYSGADCSSLEYIYCEDDNTTFNGSLMPVISVTGSPNETIWVRVWGYAGTTGSFSICVFDYQSNNYAGVDDATDAIAGEVEAPIVLAKPYIEYSSVNPTLHISPNPTRDVLQVSYTQTETSIVSRIVLMDMSGKVVYKKDYLTTDLQEFKDEVNVSTMAPGMYVLRVVTTTGILSEKISVID